MTITPEEIARLRALEAKATPGPWWREWNNADDHDDGIDVLARGHGGRVALVEDSEIRGTRETGHGPAAIADIIVAARNALPGLLDEIERLRADLREAVALLRGMAPALAFLRPFQEATEIDQMQAKCDALLAKHKEEA